MGEPNLVTKNFLSDNARFADIVNAGAFDGEQILEEKALESIDPYTGILSGNKKKAEEHCRDLLKKSAYGVNFLLVGIENQDEIHYAMPLRVMGYDFRSYDREFRKIKNRHKRRRDLSGAEFLSGFSKADRLKPIITLVVYYGENPWDGPLSLKDMLDWSGIPEKIKQKVQDYPVYFLDVRRFSGIEKMKTDARLVFGFLQRQDDREKLAEYIQKNAEEFDRLDSDAGDMITVLANIEEPMRKYMEESKNERGEVKVCKALTEMREEARLEGERAERERSEMILKEEQEKNIKIIVELCKESGMKLEKVLQKLQEKCDLTREEAEINLEKYW